MAKEQVTHSKQLLSGESRAHTTFDALWAELITKLTEGINAGERELVTKIDGTFQVTDEQPPQMTVTITIELNFPD